LVADLDGMACVLSCWVFVVVIWLFCLGVFGVCLCLFFDAGDCFVLMWNVLVFVYLVFCFMLDWLFVYFVSVLI